MPLSYLLLKNKEEVMNMKKFFIVFFTVIFLIVAMPAVDAITGYERCNHTASFIHDAVFMLYGSIVVLLSRYIRFG
ncbi:MAG TPA: hypothetical protein P5230_02065 [Candidatus Magasanikbacteria bacterium]|nr:hypothetical protein [Candidatus Magasanikbacteria bacterium]